MDEKIDSAELEPLASEMYKDLKEANKFKEKIIVWMAMIIALLVAGMIGLSVYHNYKWSEFDTIVVDSNDGGNANYVGGDNAGGIFNGEGNSEEAP